MKIPTLFERDWDGDRSRVINKVHPGCEWVLAGEGKPTQKIDGTACFIDEHGFFFKRREVRKGDVAPTSFILEDEDETTGKLVGWVLVHPDDPADRYHREAFKRWTELYGKDRRGQTFELVGPKIQGNPEGYEFHLLIPHDSAQLDVEELFGLVPRDFGGLHHWLSGKDIEGIVWHHPTVAWRRSSYAISD